MKIDFNTKTTCGDDDDDKYIKTKIKAFKDSIITNYFLLAPLIFLYYFQNNL